MGRPQGDYEATTRLVSLPPIPVSETIRKAFMALAERNGSSIAKELTAALEMYLQHHGMLPGSPATPPK